FIAEGTDFFDLRLADRRVAVSAQELTQFPPSRQAAVFRAQSDVQRYLFLEELVDTPMKLAYAGCLYGWRGGSGTPPLMFQDFYSYEAEMARFMRHVAGIAP